MTRFQNSAGAAMLACLAALPAAADERHFDLDGFARVEVTSGLSAVITGGGDYEVRAESSDQRTLRRLDIRTVGDRLYVGRQREWSGLAWFRARKEATIYVTLPMLAGVEASAGSDVYATGKIADAFRGDASSGADLTLDAVDAGKVWLSASSGADLRAAGSCATLEADASSGATLRTQDMICADVRAEASSGADVRVHATVRIHGEASSGGDVWVSGNPTAVEIDESSGGSVNLNR